MGVSKNRDTPKSSILIGFSIINHPFWGTPILGNTYIGNHFKNYGSFSQNPPFQVSSETSPPGLLGYLRCPTTKTYRLRWLLLIQDSLPPKESRKKILKSNKVCQTSKFVNTNKKILKIWKSAKSPLLNEALKKGGNITGLRKFTVINVWVSNVSLVPYDGSTHQHGAR